MVSLSINGMLLKVPEGTTILDAAKELNFRIPTLCNHEDLCVAGNCRVCVVEQLGGRALLAACATPVSEGLQILTNSLKVRAARKHVIELLLSPPSPKPQRNTYPIGYYLSTRGQQFQYWQADGFREGRFKGMPLARLSIEPRYRKGLTAVVSMLYSHPWWMSKAISVAEIASRIERRVKRLGNSGKRSG